MALDNDTRQAIDNLKSKIQKLEKENAELKKEVGLVNFKIKGYNKRFNILQKLFIRKTRRHRQ